MENQIDPWLYPGCVCEVWDTDSAHLIQLRYFRKISGTDHKIFSTLKDLRDGIPWQNYKQLNTPWDYAPKEAIEISIDKDGNCIFINKYKSIMLLSKNVPYEIIWKDCQDHLKGKVWPRPEWAIK